MHHILLGIGEGWRRRRELRALLQETPAGRSVLEIVPEELGLRGVQALALDFDGVLAPHGGDQPLPDVEIWLRRTVEVCGAEQVFILSNRPKGPRVAWFHQHLPGVRFISGVRKKPYGDGLVKVGQLASVPLSAILMVDDRLLTGCLAAIGAGSMPWYVRAPFVDLRHNFHKELFFMLLRWGERLFVRSLP